MMNVTAPKHPITGYSSGRCQLPIANSKAIDDLFTMSNNEIAYATIRSPKRGFLGYCGPNGIVANKKDAIVLQPFHKYSWNSPLLDDTFIKVEREVRYHP